MQIDYPDTASLLKALRASAQRTTVYFDLAPEDLARTYAPGKWPVLILLHHLA